MDVYEINRNTEGSKIEFGDTYYGITEFKYKGYRGYIFAKPEVEVKTDVDIDFCIKSLSDHLDTDGTDSVISTVRDVVVVMR